MANNDSTQLSRKQRTGEKGTNVVPLLAYSKQTSDGNERGVTNTDSVESFLADTLRRITAGDLVATSAVVLLLDEDNESAEDGRYFVWQGTHGLRRPETIALLECAKSMNVRDMGF